MKFLIVMTTILFAFSQGCSKSTSDQNFQDHQDRQSSTKDSDINSLSNRPAAKEGL